MASWPAQKKIVSRSSAAGQVVERKCPKNMAQAHLILECLESILCSGADFHI